MSMLAWLFSYLLLASASGVIYKWTDAQGNVHYGDEPAAPGARQMTNLPGLSTYSPPRLPVLDTGKADRKEAPPARSYRMVRIISPEPEGTVRSAPGEVSIYVALDPVLEEGDYLQVVLDGHLLPARYTRTVIRLDNLDRGAHRLLVEVRDQAGRRLGASEEQVFYLHRVIARPN